MHAKSCLPIAVALVLFVCGCGSREGVVGPQMDVTRFLNATKEEAIQVLGEPSQDMDSDLVWQADRLPPGFSMLVLKFYDEPVCVNLNGHIEMPGDAEGVLNAIGLGELQREGRRSQVLNAVAVHIGSLRG